MKKCLILANGQPPKIEQVIALQKQGYNTLYCADGGADSALELNLIPDFIIGDLDSISFKALDYYNKRSEIIKLNGQNDTDVEKCLKHAIENNFSEAVLLGATGDRLDHSFCNIGIALKFFDLIKVNILHSSSFLSVYNQNVTFQTTPGETISLYGFDSRTKITTHGLKYPVINGSLVFGVNESTSNEAVGNIVTIEVTGGKIFIVRNSNVILTQ